MQNSPLTFALEYGHYDYQTASGKDVVVTTPTLEIFFSADCAAAKREGIDIAEGDLHFFAFDGSPLKAVFSQPPAVDNDKKCYSKGVYTLEAADAGENLKTALAGFVAKSPTPDIHIIVYIASNNASAKWYGWPDAIAMEKGVAQALKILPADLAKHILIEKITRRLEFS